MPLLLPGGIVPSDLPEMLMCMLQMRLWFHDSLIRSKLGLPQSLHPQLLPLPVPARMLSGPTLNWFRKDRTNAKNCNTSLPVQLPVESNKHQHWCKRWGGDIHDAKPGCNSSGLDQLEPSWNCTQGWASRRLLFKLLVLI